jgi:hypothetical protein
VASPSRDIVMTTVQDLLVESPAVRRAYDAMIARGLSDLFVREQIGRAYLGCLWEALHGLPDRFPAVLQALSDGRTTAELFPNKQEQSWFPDNLH